MTAGRRFGPARQGSTAGGQDGAVPLLEIPMPSAAVVDQQAGDPALERMRRAVAAAGWPGLILPATRLTSSVVYPVVALLPAAAQRLASGWGPVLDGETLELWESWPATLGNLPPAPPVRVVGFASDVPGSRGLGRVVALRGFGAGMVVRRRATTWQAWEADVASTWLVQDAEAKSKVVVAGRHGPVHTARRVVATRLIEERLFDHAIRCGALTASPVSA